MVYLKNTSNGNILLWKNCLRVDCALRRCEYYKQRQSWAVVVAQLVEWLLPIPEVRGSNPVIGNFYIYIEHLFTVKCVLKRQK